MQVFPKVYVAVYLEDKHALGLLPEIGQWHNYYVYEIEDHLAVRLELLKVDCVHIPNKEIAHAWKFTDPARDFLVIRNEALDFYNLDNEQTSFHKIGKRKYVLTEADKRNGLALAKAILRGELHRKCRNVLSFTSHPSSTLYSEFMDYVYCSGDTTLISKTEKEYPNIVSSYRKRQEDLRSLLTHMENAEGMIDSMQNSTDVRRVTETLFEMYSSLPTRLLNDRKTTKDARSIS